MKILTEELIETKIVYLRSKVYSLNKFKLSEKYLTEHNLTHLSYILNPVELFNKLKSENSILIRKHTSYQWESSCVLCSKPTEFVSWYFGFKKYCSKECEFSVRLESINLKIHKEKDIIVEKRKKTKLERYGDENYNNVEQIVKTQNELYGGTFNLVKSKETKLERYGDENYNNSIKQQETCQVNCLERYGVQHYSQLGTYNMNRYKWKEYEMPSGELLKIQGYEPFLLDELLLEYKEDEIITERKDMPPIWYIGLDEKKHRYFPDVFIPKTNTIYEVKSNWTLNVNKEINELKFQAVKDAGYNFILKVY